MKKKKGSRAAGDMLEKRIKDHLNHKYGKLKVIAIRHKPRLAHHKTRKSLGYECSVYCGYCEKESDKWQNLSKIVSGEVKSCGCLRETGWWKSEKQMSRYPVKAGDTCGILVAIDGVAFKKEGQKGSLANTWFIKAKCSNCGDVIDVKRAKFYNGGYKACGKRFCSPDFESYLSHLLPGEKFGKLTIIKEVERKQTKKGPVRQYLVVCECGKERVVAKPLLTRSPWPLRSCGTCSYKFGNEHPSFTGYEEIWGDYWQAVKNGAKSRGLKFNITLEYVWSLYEKQGRVCKLSGIPIRFKKSQRIPGTKSRIKTEQTASLDRIDSSKGYVEGNVQWVHKDINQMKWQLLDSQFIEYCKLVADNN